MQWFEHCNYPAGVLLHSLKLAVEWPKEYRGLTEQQLNAVAAQKEQEWAEGNNELSFDEFPDFDRWSRCILKNVTVQAVRESCYAYVDDFFYLLW
jgi:hypothetical protein